jgi:DNA repair exonuclease SbcCD ATPase subunit
MKKVTFTKITIQNFLSIGEDPVIVNFREGLHIITGRNLDKPDRQNAVGKSTVADAIYFAIFGETLRELKKELILNNITGGKTNVTLEFEVDSPKGRNKFIIQRTLNPTKASIFKDGVDKTRDSIANTTKYICEVLSATPAMFQNCVIMTVNSATPFMAKSKVDKRKFIEDIFGMEVFGKMLSALRQEYNDVKRNHEIQITKLEEVDRNILNLKDQKDKALARREEKKKLYQERYESNSCEVQELTIKLDNMSELESIESVRAEIAKYETHIVDCDDKINTLIESSGNTKTELLFKKEQYKKIGTGEDKCPVCLRKIHEHDREVFDAEKNKLKETIHNLADSVQDLANKTLKIKSVKEKVKQAISIKTSQLNDLNIKQRDKKNINERIIQLNKWQDELVIDLDSINFETTEYDELINETTQRYNNLQKETENISEELDKMNVVKYIVSEEGIKSFIVNKLLELLNNRLYYYLRKLDSNSICTFDEYFEEQIVNEKNKICSYFNFSGAERKSIDLACLFTFSDLRRMQGGVSYNIAIYDELFDSSFDEKGIELITEILHERVTTLNECSIVITHRKESHKAITGDVIFLEKENGITRQVDYIE